MQLFKEAGMFGIPLLILTLAVVGLTVRGLTGGRERRAAAVSSVLFWGAAAAVLGVLGQCSGLYNALRAIAAAEAVSPALVARGFAESFSTSLWGFGLLLAALVLAAVLRRLGAGAEEVAGAP